jgi:hypothetical protein
MKEAAMTRHRYYDNYEGAFDENGLLRDGRRVRVPMMMRDGMSPMQRAVVENKMRRGFDDSAARYQPGPVPCTDAAANAERARAYGEMCDDLQNAWCGPSTEPAIMNDREVARLHDTGNPVADAYLDSVADLTTAWSRRR